MSEEVAAPVVEAGAVGSATGAVKKPSMNKVVRKTKAAKTSKSGGVGGAALSAHPPTKQMVDAAIKSLKERGGSSLPAIKKYIGATYKCDAQKLAPFIKKYLKSAVASGKLIQTKGKGASGSFKLSVRAKQTASSAAGKPHATDKPKKDTKKVKSAASGGSVSSGSSSPRKPKAKSGAKLVKGGKKTATGRKATAGTLSSPSKASTKSNVSGGSVAAAVAAVTEKKAKSAKGAGSKALLKGVKPGSGVVKAKVSKAATAATKPKAPKAKSAAAVKAKKAAVVGAAGKKAVATGAGKK